VPEAVRLLALSIVWLERSLHRRLAFKGNGASPLRNGSIPARSQAFSAASLADGRSL
jgi:hypothetical protein